MKYNLTTIHVSKTPHEKKVSLTLCLPFSPMWRKAWTRSDHVHLRTRYFLWTPHVVISPVFNDKKTIVQWAGGLWVLAVNWTLIMYVVRIGSAAMISLTDGTTSHSLYAADHRLSALQLVSSYLQSKSSGECVNINWVHVCDLWRSGHQWLSCGR